ncbi:MAG: SEC-C domain-containing protein [Spirochaetales bacterium]|nr:SEC-C domain-containing protein [Spirochaetales bacterium]
MNKIDEDKYIKMFECNFQKGKFKGKNYIALMKIMCDSPTCHCSDIIFVLREKDTPEPKEYSFVLDVFNKKINKSTAIQIPNRNNGFAVEFVANLTDETWNDFYNFFREYKDELCKDYESLKHIVADFSDIEYSIEKNREMIAFMNIFPYPGELRCTIESIDYLLDDQYCLASDCNCHDVGLTIIEMDTLKSKKPAKTSTILYDYIKNKWKIAVKGDKLSHSTETIISQMQMANPDFPYIFRKRHETLRSMYSNYINNFHGSKQPLLQSQKTGRNAPCPCGSGKKYKHCCG